MERLIDDSVKQQLLVAEGEEIKEIADYLNVYYDSHKNKGD